MKLKKTVTIKIIISFLILVCQIAYADGLDPLLNLSLDISDIAKQSVLLKPVKAQEFNLSSNSATLAQQISDIDSTTSQFLLKRKINESQDSEIDCDKTPKNDPTLLKKFEKKLNQAQLRFAFVYSSKSSDFNKSIMSLSHENPYNEFMSVSLSQYPSETIGNISNIDQLISTCQNQNSNDLNTFKILDRSKILSNCFKDLTKKDLPESLVLSGLILREIVDVDPKNWKTTLENVKNNLSSDQKIQLISRLGYWMNNNYNYSRANSNGAENGSHPDTESLLLSIKNGTPGGVCRDISLAQAQMISALGFKNSYVVAFNNGSSGHATMITQDPDSKKIIKFNYDETYTEKAGSGTSALNQDTTLPNQGIKFRVYNSNGKPVANVPTDLALVLRDATGDEARSYLRGSNYEIRKVTIGLKYGEANLFKGTTLSGDNISGLAYFGKWENENLSIDGGIAIASNKKTGTSWDTSENHKYARIGLENRIPFQLGNVTITPFDKINLEATSYQTALKSNTGQSNTSVTSKDVSASIDLGIRSISDLKDGKLSTEANTHIIATTTNVADQTSGLAVQSLNLKTKYENQIFVASASVALTHYGASLAAEAEWKINPNNSLGVSVRTPLKKDMPTFLEGGEKIYGIDYTYATINGIRCKVEIKKRAGEKPTYSSQFEKKF
jgi:hypothetical protein